LPPQVVEKPQNDPSNCRSWARRRKLTIGFGAPVTGFTLIIMNVVFLPEGSAVPSYVERAVRSSRLRGP